MADLEKETLTLKTVVLIIVAVVTWVGSLCAVYFPMQSKINDAETRVTNIELRFNKYNFDVLDYKMGEMKIQIDAQGSKIDNIYTIVSAGKRTGR